MPDSNSNRPAKLSSASPPIHRLLARLRRGIRRHILLEGLAWIIVWTIGMFGIALAIDYLPVRFALDEMSRTARIVVIAVVSAGFGWILVTNILNRLFTSLNNESMAVLVERKYPEFNASLVTTVEHFGRREIKTHPSSQSMQRRTQNLAESLTPRVKVSEILNSHSLRLPSVMVGVLVLSLVATVISHPSFANRAFNRIVMLKSMPWPRTCSIKLANVKVARQNPVEGIPELDAPLQRLNNQFKIARGSSVTINVEAESANDFNSSRRLPDNCRIYMTSSSGARSSFKMTRVGAPRNGKQIYSFSDQTLSSVLDDIEFEVRGGDDRTESFKLNVVSPPSVEETLLACVYPEYMVDQDSGRWTPREKPWVGTNRLPLGTSVTIRSTTNKPLQTVYVFDVIKNRMATFETSGNRFEIPLLPLSEPVQQEIYLCDTDGIVSEQPFRLSIAPIDDQPPVVRTKLIGIGTAVTPNVRIPFEGIITDDYGIGQANLEFAVGQGAPVVQPLEFEKTGELESVLDFHEKLRTLDKADERRLYQLSATEGSTLSLIVKAEDRFDLDSAAQIGFGDKYVLDIVDDNQLVRILERLEIAQRQRLEQIYIEVGEARDFLVRTSAFPKRQRTLVEPSDADVDSDSDTDPLTKVDVRLLFAQRSRLQAEKTKQELLGVTEAFENIRQQLINNRIDSEDRKNRIQNRIVLPLRVVATDSIGEFLDLVNELESLLRKLQDGSSSETELNMKQSEAKTDQAILQADLILNELKMVLGSLVKYETQNELLEIVRQMIRQQKAIMARTKKERQQKAFEGLLD